VVRKPSTLKHGKNHQLNNPLGPTNRKLVYLCNISNPAFRRGSCGEVRHQLALDNENCITWKITSVRMNTVGSEYTLTFLAAFGGHPDKSSSHPGPVGRARHAQHLLHEQLSCHYLATVGEGTRTHKHSPIALQTLMSWREFYPEQTIYLDLTNLLWYFKYYRPKQPSRNMF
jgi:hypothetical protein